MDNIELVRQYIYGLLGFWPITLILLGAMFLAVRMQMKGKKVFLEPVFYLSLTPALLTFSIFMVGIFYKKTVPLMYLFSSWPWQLNQYLLISHLPVLALLMFRFKNYRWVVFTFSVFFIFTSCLAYYISNCSISGDWGS